MTELDQIENYIKSEGFDIDETFSEIEEPKFKEKALYSWKNYVPQFFKDDWKNLSTITQVSIFLVANRAIPKGI